MDTPKYSKFIFSLSSLVVFVGFVSDAFSTRDSLVGLWPNLSPFLPLLTLGAGIAIGVWFVIATADWIWKWVSPRRKKELFRELRAPILESITVLETDGLNNREYWDAVRTIRDKLSDLKIDCPEIEYPVQRRPWAEFLGWQAALASSGRFSEAETVMKERNFSRIVSVDEHRQQRLDEITRRLDSRNLHKE